MSNGAYTATSGQIDSTAALIRDTLYGDANLDGTVNLTDFNRLAADFGMTSGAVWYDGDFTYDGAVNLADFNKLAANFGNSVFGEGEEESGFGGGDGHYTYEELLDILMQMYPQYF